MFVEPVELVESHKFSPEHVAPKGAENLLDYIGLQTFSPYGAWDVFVAPVCKRLAPTGLSNEVDFMVSGVCECTLIDRLPDFSDPGRIADQ